jgi:hypothetical protein
VVRPPHAQSDEQPEDDRRAQQRDDEVGGDISLVDPAIRAQSRPDGLDSERRREEQVEAGRNPGRPGRHGGHQHEHGLERRRPVARREEGHSGDQDADPNDVGEPGDRHLAALPERRRLPRRAAR